MGRLRRIISKASSRKNSKPAKPAIIERLEPRIMLSGDGLLSCLNLPDPVQNTPAINTSIHIQNIEVTNQAQHNSENATDPEICKPIFTISQDNNDIETTGIHEGQDEAFGQEISAQRMRGHDENSSLDDVAIVQSNEDVVIESSGSDESTNNKISPALSIDIQADETIENSTAIRTEDGSMPVYNSDADLSIEYATSIEIRGPPGDTADSLTISDYSADAISDELAESSDVESSYAIFAPELTDLQLVDLDISSWNGQIIYLDFDGAEDVIYNGPVTIGPFDVPAFEAPSELAENEAEIIAAVTANLNDLFTNTGIIFTRTQPAKGIEYSTVYIGGDDFAFSQYGSFHGLAEQVDFGNKNRCDEAFVFSGQLNEGSLDSFAKHLAGTVAHEAGHLLGYAHENISSGDCVLSEVACYQKPDPGPIFGPNPILVSWNLYEDTGNDPKDKLTNDTKPILKFNFSEAVYIQKGSITITDPLLNPITPAAITNWGSNRLMIEFSTPLKIDGKYTITFHANAIHDADGNPLNKGIDEVVFFYLDTQAPAVQFGLAEEFDSEPVGDDETTFNPVILEGSTEPNIPVSLFHSGDQTVPISTATADATGFFEFTGVDLILGENPFTVVATDLAGNKGFVERTITHNPPYLAYLIEGTNFKVTYEQTYIVPDEPSFLAIIYRNLFFDTNDDFINDAFEIALLNSEGNSLVHTIAIGRDAFFNITEKLSISAGANTIVDGETVKVDLSHIPDGTEVNLVIRLVNNDADTTTSVAIANITMESGSLGTPVGITLPVETVGTTEVINFELLSDVTASIQSGYGRTSFNEINDILYADLRLENAGTYFINTPLIVVIDHLSEAGVHVIDADGVTPDGLPYFEFSALIAGGALEPSESTGSRNITFFNPDGVQFTYDLVVLSMLNHAPEFISDPNTEALAGHTYSYDAEAIDLDEDVLAYSLLSAPEGMTIDPATGLISWEPLTDDTGNHSVIIKVHDGRGGSAEQVYTLSVLENVPNRPPVFTSTPLVDAYVDSEYEYDADAMDPDHDPLSFELVAGPDGMVIDTETGLVEWMPAGNQLGEHEVEIEVTDGRGGTATQSFIIAVQPDPANNPPVIISEPVTTAFPVGGPIVLGPGSSWEYTFVDPTSNANWNTITGGWNIGPAPFGNTTGPVSPDTQGYFSYETYWPQSPSWGDDLWVRTAVNLSNYDLSTIEWDLGVDNGFKLYINGNLVAEHNAEGYTYRWEYSGIIPTNDLVQGINIVAVALEDHGSSTAFDMQIRGEFIGQGYTYDVEAIDPDNDELTYALELAPTGMVINTTTGLIQWSPSVNQIGSHDVTVRVEDGRGGFDEQSFTIFVDVVYLTDLEIANVDRHDLTYDGQALTAHGTVTAEITNLGLIDVVEPFDVLFFEDRDHNGLYDEVTDNPLGLTTITDPLLAGEIITASAEVSGSVLFVGNIVWGFVDSSDVILETSEGNNLAHSGENCRTEPVVGQFDPVVEWNKSTFSVRPESDQVMMTPAVADMNGDDIPDIVFITFTGRQLRFSGILRAISGDNGQELWSITDAAYQVAPQAGIAIGDIDVDGLPEIITFHESLSVLIAFEHDGSFKWISPRVWSSWLGASGSNKGAPSLADLDADGVPEIIAGGSVLNADGTVRWQGNLNGGFGKGMGHSAVADLDMDGSPEVVAGRSAYRADGTVYWNAMVGDGCVAVADFDIDPYPEIVLVTGGNVYLLEHTGEIKWGPSPIPLGGRGGAPTVADMDGDGEPEIGVAGGGYYVVFETDGSEKWSSPIQDWSSQFTGSTVFDFEGDGRAEVVYNDELYLRIYDGVDGTVLFEFPKSSGTAFEEPLIVDVDADGNAEIVAVANQYGAFEGKTGIYVIGDANDTWVSTRQIWNQHTYHITNVNDDGTIPIHEENSWEIYNTYRLNLQTAPGGPLAAPNLTASFVRATLSGDDVTFTVRIGNGGAILAPDGVLVAFYDGDPQNGGIFLGTVETTSSLEPGYFEDVQITLSLADVNDLWVWADDDGTGRGQVSECNEEDNIYHPGFFVSEPENRKPSITSTPLTNALMSELYRYNAEAVDPDGDPLVFDLPVRPDGMVVDSDLGIVVWTPKTEQQGLHDVILRVRDGRGGVDLQAFQITVGVENTAPIITSIPRELASVDVLYHYQVTAQDAEGDPLTFHLDSAPHGMAIDAATGLIEWTPTSAQEGENEVIVRVQDTGGLADTQSFTIIIETTCIVDGMVSYWKFDEGNGTIAYDSIGENHGTVYGATWTDGIVKGALSFDGVVAPLNPADTYVTIEDTPSLRLHSQGTIEAWIMTTLEDNPWNSHIVSKQVGDGQRDSYALWYTSSETISFRPYSSDFLYAPIPSVNEWHHVAGVWDEFNVRLYINGVLVDSEPHLEGVSIPYDDNPVLIGADDNNDDNLPDEVWNGNIDEVAIYNIALTEEELYQHYLNGLSGHCYGYQVCEPVEGMISYWKFDEAGVLSGLSDGLVAYYPFSGNANDASGNGHHGSVYGATSSTDRLGNPDQAYSFDGLDDYIRIPHSPDLNVTTTGFTLSLWVRAEPDQFGWDQHFLIIDKSHTGLNNTGWVLQGHIDPDWSVAFMIGNGSGYPGGWLAPPQRLLDGQWHHIAGTFDGDNIISLYFDGEPEHSGVLNGLLHPNDRDVFIGVWVYGNRNFHGSIDEVRIYNRALSAEEIRILSEVAYDYIGENHGTVYGATWTSGIVDGALNFDGVDDYVIVPDDPSLNPSHLTIETWVNLNRVVAWPDNQFIICKGNDRTAGSYFLYQGADQFHFNIGAHGYGLVDVHTSSLNLVTDRWYHVVGTYDGSNLELYVDGVLEGSTTADIVIGNTGDLTLGYHDLYWAGTWWPYYLDGDLDETALYNRVLSAEEIQRHYQNGLSGYCYGWLGDLNSDPIITSVPRDNIALGHTYRYQIVAIDRDYDPLVYSFDSAPAGMTINDSGLVEWTSDLAQLGVNSVVIYVEDGRGGLATQEFVVEVVTEITNTPPEIISVPLGAATIGIEYAYNAEGTDADGDPLFWSLDSAPDGMSISEQHGTVRWIPSPTQLGDHEIIVQVFDGQGGWATQTFTLTVYAVNIPPAITSIPSTQAFVDHEYSYAVQATDVDGDVLQYSLNTAPEGMVINSETGLVQWTPEITQIGDWTVEILVQDGHGGYAQQTYTLVTLDEEPNDPPDITSVPILFANVGELYEYDAEATDPNGDPLTFYLALAPDGMVIDPDTGLLQWTPTLDQLGLNQVSVEVTDGRGAGAGQDFSILVSSDNQAPIILSAPEDVAVVGLLWSYDVIAEDPDGDPLTFSLGQAPVGMSIDEYGRIRWTPDTDDIGAHLVEIMAVDPFGLGAIQTFELPVIVDTQPPSVILNVSENPVTIDSEITVIAWASDNVGVQSIEVTLEGTPITLGPEGQATLLMDTVGEFDLTLNATDLSGNVSTVSIILIVFDPSDVTAPTVEITTPEYGDTISTFTDVIGTVDDDNLLSYSLEVAPASGGDFVEIAHGTTTVIDGLLGVFDPTVLSNDTYILRLSATDAGGNYSLEEIELNVAGELKLGNFRLSFMDLSIPVSGIPIIITRTYDSLIANKQDDFGYGWRMELSDTDLGTNLPETGLEDFGIYTGFHYGTRIYITTPDGRREGFTFTPTGPRNMAEYIMGIWHPAFTPDSGVTSQLTVQDVYLQFVESTGQFHFYGGWAYNPADTAYCDGKYTLMTQDGLVYSIDALTGDLQTLSDTNGNTLTFTESGVISSAGVTVDFERDAQGRITAVVDPSGNRIEYAYDARGDLVSVTDRDGYITRFVYLTDPQHYLDEIIDPLGRTGVRSEYDEQGRLISLIDAAGNTVGIAHDPDNSVEAIVDSLGNVTTYEYDEKGNVVTEIDALGGITVRTYDSNNFLLSETDPLGNTTTYTYDSYGNILTQTDALENTTIYTYGEYGRLLTITDPLGNTTTNTYDGSGNLLSTMDALGNITTYTYDGAGNMTSITDPLDNVTAYEYDSSGNLIRQIDPLGNDTTYTYDSNGNQTSMTDALGYVTTYEYDASGRLVRQTDALGNITETEYDATGKMVATIDALDRRTEYVYDERGLLIETIFPDDTPADLSDNPRIQTEYDAAGRAIARINELGHRTLYVYDALGRLIEIVFPDDTPEDLSDNPRAYTEYDDAGRTIVRIDELGNRTEFEYDEAGRQILVRDALGNETVSTYDDAGRLISTTNALGNTTQYVYDDLGRVMQTVLADGSITMTAYDALGRLITETDQAGRVTQFEYDALGRLTAVVDALGQRTEYTYDEVGNHISQTDANGHTTSFEYDALRRRIATILPLGQRSETSYNAVGLVVATTDYNGDTITYEYDARNRLTAKRFPDGTSVLFTYKLTGQRETVTDSRGVTTFTYDARGRLLNRTDPDSTTIAYTYDMAGNRTSVTIPSGTTIYTFDVLNRMETVTDPDGGATAYTFDALGRLIRTDLPNGTFMTMSYNVLNQLLTVEHTGPGGIFASFSYTYDAAGNRIAVDELGGRRVEYTYDALNRLNEESITDPVNGNRVISFTYDPVGNRLSRDDSAEGTTNYTYDDNDRLLTETLNGQVTTYTYDDNGNTITKDDGTVTVTYYWNYENRLVAVDTDGDGVIDVEYFYDANGIRVAKIAGGQETRFLIDTNRRYAQVLEEYAPDGTIEVVYVYGIDLISQKRDTGKSFYHVDGLGSTRALTDETGIITDTYIYDAYGRIIAQTGSTPNSYLFTGEQHDYSIGLYHLRARYLNVGIGRFYAADSFVGMQSSPLSLNKYIYVHADPVNRIDPSGQWVTLIEVATAANIQVVLWQIALPQIVFGALEVGITLVWSSAMRPVFEARNTAILMIADGIAIEKALDMYISANQAIGLGFRVLGLALETSEFAKSIVELGTSVADLANAVSAAERYFFRLPMLMLALKNAADSIPTGELD